MGMSARNQTRFHTGANEIAFGKLCIFHSPWKMTRPHSTVTHFYYFDVWRRFFCSFVFGPTEWRQTGERQEGDMWLAAARRAG